MGPRASSRCGPTAAFHATEQRPWRAEVAPVACARWPKQEFACWCRSRAVCGLLSGCRPYPRQSPCPDTSFLMPLAVDGRRRRCPAFTPVIRRATRVCAIQPIRLPSRRSSRSCVSPGRSARPAAARADRCDRGRPRAALALRQCEDRRATTHGTNLRVIAAADAASPSRERRSRCAGRTRGVTAKRGVQRWGVPCEETAHEPDGSPTRRQTTAAAGASAESRAQGPGGGAAAAKCVTPADRDAGGGSPAGQKRCPGGWRGTRCQTELAESEAVSGDRTRPPPAHGPPRQPARSNRSGRSDT